MSAFYDGADCENVYLINTELYATNGEIAVSVQPFFDYFFSEQRHVSPFVLEANAGTTTTHSSRNRVYA